jgi:hypothetical protein
MSILLVTYANEKFSNKQLMLCQKAVSNNFKIARYTERWLQTTEFYKKNKRILDQPRGAGYWLWKPFVIKDALTTLAQKEDIVFYIDSGDVFYLEVDNVLFENQLKIEMNNVDQLFITYGNNNAKWTKRDCFVYMNCDSKDYWQASQLEAGVSFWKNTDSSIKLLDEWLIYCMDERILTDIPNESGQDNFVYFQDHRHDQSILTNLVVKYNLKIDNGNIRKYTFPNA